MCQQDRYLGNIAILDEFPCFKELVTTPWDAALKCIDDTRAEIDQRVADFVVGAHADKLDGIIKQLDRCHKMQGLQFLVLKEALSHRCEQHTQAIVPLCCRCLFNHQHDMVQNWLAAVNDSELIDTCEAQEQCETAAAGDASLGIDSATVQKLSQFVAVLKNLKNQPTGLAHFESFEFNKPFTNILSSCTASFSAVSAQLDVKSYAAVAKFNAIAKISNSEELEALAMKKLSEVKAHVEACKMMVSDFLSGSKANLSRYADVTVWKSFVATSG